MRKGGERMRKTVVRTIEKEPRLSGDNIVAIVIAMKELIINIADNYRMVRMSQVNSISEGGR